MNVSQAKGLIPDMLAILSEHANLRQGWGTQNVILLPYTLSGTKEPHKKVPFLTNLFRFEDLVSE